MSWELAGPTWMGQGNSAGSGVGLIFGGVLCRPFWGCFKCLFDEAGLGIRYFCTIFAVRCVVPFRKPALIALSNKDIGGLHQFWCMNLTAFSLLV